MALRFMCLLCVIVLLAVVFVCVGAVDINKHHRTKSLEKILKGYDSKIPPDYDSGTPVSVLIELAVLSIDNIDEAAMDYSMTIYLRQKWIDERLVFEPFNVTSAMERQKTQEPNAQPSSSSTPAIEKLSRVSEGKLEFDARAMNKVWVPDTFFYNERKARFHDMTVPNKLLHVFSNGTVYYSMRISLTLTCHMNLGRYPFDRQNCPLRLGSYGYSNEILEYDWNPVRPFTFSKGMELPTFTISQWHVENCSTADFDGLSVGSFSCLALTVNMARSYGFYIAQVYVPSILVVILSWVSFWLDIEAIPARISLGLLTVLTMTTMGVGSRSSLPRVSYLKAIDVWNAVGLLFVFSALLEFAYVNVTTRVEKRRLSMKDAVNMATGKETNRPTLANIGKHAAQPAKLTVESRQRARLIDKVARIVFPSSFVLFNIFYWCFYMI